MPIETLVENIDFYYDDNGYMVFTEVYHINKGYCCGHGCKHCPFDFESVPEPKKSILLKELKKQV